MPDSDAIVSSRSERKNVAPGVSRGDSTQQHISPLQRAKEPGPPRQYKKIDQHA